MTKTDTSAEAVEIMAEYYAGWARDIRAQGVHSEDARYRDETAATLRALRAQLDKTEARAQGLERARDYNAEVIDQRNAMLTRADAERDAAYDNGWHAGWKDAEVAAWNDAIEAVAKYHDNFLMTKTGIDVEKVVVSTEAIRAMKKGQTDE